MIFINHSHGMFHYSRCQIGFGVRAGGLLITMADFDREMLCLRFTLKPASLLKAQENLKITLRLTKDEFP